jgi:hypothetical protein
LDAKKERGAFAEDGKRCNSRLGSKLGKYGGNAGGVTGKEKDRTFYLYLQDFLLAQDGKMPPKEEASEVFFMA